MAQNTARVEKNLMLAESDEIVIEIREEDDECEQNVSEDVIVLDSESMTSITSNTQPSDTNSGGPEENVNNGHNLILLDETNDEAESANTLNVPEFDVEVNNELDNNPTKTTNNAFECVQTLQMELERLRGENELLRNSNNGCTSCNNSMLTNDCLIQFRNAHIFTTYKKPIIDAFHRHFTCISLGFTIVEDEANHQVRINVADARSGADDWHIIDVDSDPMGTSTPQKKRRKKSHTPDSDGLFTLDTTPSLNTRVEGSLKYRSKFSVTANQQQQDKTTNAEVARPSASCFNCDQSHNLKDCPLPKNYGKINAARQKQRSNNAKSVRYHVDEEQKFSHLRPGKISDKLRDALGLSKYDLPDYIYRMRGLGYPPGWFLDAQHQSTTDLVIFDLQSLGTLPNKRKTNEVDAYNVIEYPGFNMPLEKGVKDNCKMFGLPPFSWRDSKERMVDLMRDRQKQMEDNLLECSMEIDVDKEIEQSDLRNSPSLVELESQKNALLAELQNDTGSNSLNQTVVSDDSNATIKSALNNTDADLAVVDNASIGADEQEINSATPIPTSVKTSSFGTPILKTASPYSKLPKAENFSKDVCDVINFENLPNSTGKYEQMTDVLTKVRETLKTINGKT